jgi:hypothetical protein
MAVGFLLGLVTVCLLRFRTSPTDDGPAGTGDALLLGLLALAALLLGAFLSYLILGGRP